MSSDAKPAHDPADLLLFQIVHDVRALVRKGHTRAQILEGHVEQHCDDRARALFEEIFSAQRDLDQMMMRLAAYAEAGRTDGGGWIKLHTSILGAKLQLKPQLEEAAAALTVSGTEGVRAPSAMQAALAELISNSIRFRDASRPLAISISTQSLNGAPSSGATPPPGNPAAGEWREIRVSDNGRGWNPHHTDRMFEPLRKLEASEGFGLGLAIARRIIEGFGGTIRAEAGPSGGVFVIEFPESDDPAGEA